MTTKTRLTMLPVERKDIENPSAAGRQYLENAIANLARLWITEGVPSKAELTISGYDDDPRELYEIPEICQWAKETVKKFPVLLFFLKDTSIDRLVGWIFGPLSKQEIDSPEFLKKYEETKIEYYTKAVAESSEFFLNMGADKTTISKFYFQDMVDNTSQSSIPKPKCDICSKEVEKDTGYILSTSEVTGEKNYWKFVFLNYPKQVQAIGVDGKKLISFVIERSGDPGSWLVCEECASLFTVDKLKARKLYIEQQKENGSLASRQLGPAEWKKSLTAASEGWKSVFGNEPKPDRDDPSIPVAATIYATSKTKWNQIKTNGNS